MRLPHFLRLVTGQLPEDNPFGIVAEFDNPGALMHAAEAVRKAGYRAFDVHSPFPIHGMDEAMGVRRTILPFLVLGGGLTGCVGALAMQIWMMAYDYPLVISGKPLMSIPAYIPVTFELTILLSGFAAVGSMLFLNFLPMLYHPLFKHEPFRKATDNAFFLSIEARDKQFDVEGTRSLLESIGGRNITLLEP